jgi:hypothetical protein
MPKVKEIRKFSILRPKGLSSLDTNEQVVHGKTPQSVQSLKKQALKVKIRNAIVSPLLDYAKEVNSPNIQEYYAALRCCTILEQSQNTYLKPTHRCGSRLCPICNNIRTAKMMERVIPLVDKTKEWGLLVLTRNNRDLRGADSQKLKVIIDGLYRTISTIRQKAKRKFGQSDMLISLEVEGENYKRRDNGGLYYGYYNPHFNFFGEYDVLEFIRQEWIKSINCDEQNQKLSKIEADNINKSVLEVVKYSTKGLTTFKNGSYINVKAIDTIITAIKGKRRIMTWGAFYNPKVEKIEVEDVEKLDLIKQPYNDIPIRDQGELVDLCGMDGNVVVRVPEYVKSVQWVYNSKSTNYDYRDEWGENFELLKWKKLPVEPDIKIFVDMVPYQKWKYGNEKM